jgi:hypothetical protein
MMLQRGLSFLFGAFCVALIATKITILTIHAPTVPLGEFLFFLPTFFLPDVVAICFMRLMLRAAKGYVAIVASAVGVVTSYDLRLTLPLFLLLTLPDLSSSVLLLPSSASTTKPAASSSGTKLPPLLATRRLSRCC